MTTIGYATLDVIPSLRGAQGSLEKQAAGPMAAAGKTGGRQFGDAAGVSAGSSFKSKFQSHLKGIAAPLAAFAGGAAVVGLFQDAIAGASGLEEAGTKLQAIYGDAAREVQSFASTAAADLGQTRLQALDAAATFGTFGKAAGLAGSDLSGFSTELVSLSTDLASFYNTDVTTAIQAIGSGLRGEAEPLRQFGVLLDDATLRSEALRQGLVKTTKQALTPQQKVLAAHAVILKQTADAQGDFDRTSDGLANTQRKLTAQWEEMKTALGQRLLPAATAAATAFNDHLLPAMSAAGGLASDAVDGFRALPGPVKAAAGAFVALKLSSLIGLTGALSGGVARVSGAMDTLRTRTQWAAAAYTNARKPVFVFGQTAGQAAGGVGRLSASLSGIRAAAFGAAAALKGFVRAALPIAALTVGITLLMKFKQAQDESRQRVEEHTAALDAQTGALTAANEEIAFNALQQAGAIDAARELGISLGTVRLAAVGNTSALAAVNSRLDELAAAQEGAGSRSEQAAALMSDEASAADTLRGALGGQNDEINRASQAWKDQSEFLGAAADATDDVAGSVRTYKSDLDKTTGALKRLRDEEEGRRLDNIQERRDWIALRETLRAARQEARDGKQVLGDQSKAADANMSALLDLADQWNDSTTKVRQSKGAYEEMRQKFIEIADQMNGPNGTRQDAVKLADSLLTLPKNVDIKFRSEGYRERIAELRELRQAAKDLDVLLNYNATVRAASYGPTGERTAPPSPPSSPKTAPGVTINVDKVYAGDSGDLVEKTRRRGGGGV